ncbi:MAG: FAD-binding protein [Herbaspirillum sp.]|nr:FAD-binding protein [Herbaspirillum sp.]
MKMRIVVVGAGVAGGIIASALRLPGIELICLEASGEDDHVHAGNGLNIGPNALRALDITMPEVGAALREVSLPWRRWIARAADGAEIYCTPLAEVADRMGIRIRWSELYRAVRAGARDRIRFHTSFAGMQRQDDGRCKIVTRRGPDGVTAILDDVDLVIACDGRYSALRAEHCGTPVPRHLGVTNFRALVDDGGAIEVDDMEQWYNGPRRLIAFRLPDGLIYVSGNLPIAPEGGTPEQYKNPAFLRTAYTDGCARPDPRLDALSAVFSAQASTFHWARAQEIPARFHDVSRRVLYVGDAAHAMCPTIGQGATQAIEDAASLVALAREADAQRRLDPAVLCGAFANLRAKRVGFVKELSWDASDTLLFGADPIAGNLEKAGPAFKEKLRELYNDVPLGRDRIRAALAHISVH